VLKTIAKRTFIRNAIAVQTRTTYIIASFLQKSNFYRTLTQNLHE